MVDGVETRYLVDENRPYAQVLEEYSSNGTVQASYVYGGALDLISQTRGGTESIYLRDGHSGVRQLTNASGSVTDTYTYDAYGTLLQSTGATQNDYLYRGEQSDSNLGMQYLRARYYNQNSGRFANVDPFEGWQEQPISRHRYIYGNNSPITFIDPSGKFSLAGTLEAANILQIIGTLTAGVVLQGVVGQVLQRTTGRIQWDGYYSSINANLSQMPDALNKILIVNGGLGLLDLTTTNQTRSAMYPGLFTKFRGIWLQILGGAAIDFGPVLGGQADGGVSFKDRTVATSPSILTATQIAFMGGSAFGSATSGNTNGTVFTAGFGSGTIFSSDTSSPDFDAGYSLAQGLSIPMMFLPTNEFPRLPFYD